MSSPDNDNEEPSSTSAVMDNGVGDSSEEPIAPVPPRPPAKRRLETTIIEISDTESDDSDVCAVNSYQASADEVKRIRGEADYSSSSSSNYSSDSESPWEDDSILLEDEQLQGKPVRAQLNPRASRMDDPKLNSTIKSQEVIDRISTYWKECKDHTCEDVTLTCEPFRVCLLHNFLANPEIINNIVDDMNTLDWSRKKMDLYEFHQTADLASLTWQRSIRGIYELLKTEVMSWELSLRCGLSGQAFHSRANQVPNIISYTPFLRHLQVSSVTGLELSRVSASCSLYGPGDHLLPHDDLLADRRVAFILYLAPWRPAAHPALPAAGANENGAREEEECVGGWRRAMGGALELLARDERGRPCDVVKQIYPQNNMLALFKVGPDSFHQVSEVLSVELPRLSINGWFHGPAPAGEEAEAEAEAAPPAEAADVEPLQRPHGEVVVLSQWVDAGYMSPRSRAQVQAQMERDSEVCLRGLLLPEQYQRLCDALADKEVPWERVGPLDRRRYWRAPAAWLRSRPPEHPLRALSSLLSSAAFCRLLADCTDLVLGSYHRLELQRWTPGDYTLVPARAWYAAPRLEAVLYCGVAGAGVAGGGVVYLAPEDDAADDAALVSVPPANNALSLVYCDAGAASFTKYLGRRTMRPDDCFYIITCTYRE